MNVRKKLSGQLLLVLCAVWACQAAAEPANGSFELSDFNDATLFLDPVNWHTENYVTVAQGFIPNEFSGNKTNWRINPTVGLQAFNGDWVLVLSSGDNNVGYAKAWQRLTLGAGDKLMGVFFFGTCDYRPWNDWAEIKLEPIDGNKPTIMVAFADIELLGENFASLGGWTRFEYTLNEQQVGDYNLVMVVNDKDDQQLESYLVVDSLMVCRNLDANGPPAKGDFNCDCTVDNKDFAILANDWQYDCNHPIMYPDGENRPNYYDPNCHCLLGTDMTGVDVYGQGLVDYQDLLIFIDNWLVGVREEEQFPPQ